MQSLMIGSCTGHDPYGMAQAAFREGVAICMQGVIPVEGLDLSHVEPGLYDVHCLPLKLHGSDGAPGRCILLD